MIKESVIKNFRGIKDLKLKNLKRFNLFIGDNGSGKTGILDALFISLNPNNPNLLPRTNRFRNIEKIDYSSFFKLFFNNFNVDNPIYIENKIKGEKIMIEINPRFEQTPGSFQDADSEVETKISGLDFAFNYKNKKYQAKIEIKKDLEKQTLGLFQEPFSLSIDKSFKEIISGTYLNSFNANNLENIAIRLNDALGKKKKDKVVAFLQKYQTTIKDVYINNAGGVMINDDIFSESVPINIYGDGLVRGLAIFLSSLEGNDIIFYDEIENGLHWTKQQEVFSSMNEISKNLGNQYFITTHSQDAIKNLYQVARKLEFIDDLNVFRVEKKEDKIDLVEIKKKDLDYYIKNKVEIR